MTGIKKGITTLEVLKDDAIIRTIAVTVNNRAPTRNKTDLPDVPYKLVPASVGALDTNDLTAAQHKLLGEAALYKLVKADITMAFEGLTTYFEDADNDTLTFTSEADRTNHVVVAGYKKDGSAIFVDMLQNDPTINTFNLVTQASDAGKPGDPQSSTKERLEVETNEPLPQEYMVVQHAENQNFIRLDKATVGLRQDTVHKLRFVGGFQFINLIKSGIDDTTLVAKPAAGSEADYLTLTATGASLSPTPDPLAAGTTVNADLLMGFKVTTTGAATVTVTFHEWVPGTGGGDGAYKDPVSRTLRFSVTAITQDPVGL